MKLLILRFLVVVLTCATAVLIFTTARAQKSPVNQQFVASLSSLGFAAPSQTPAAASAQEKTVEQTRKNIKVLTGMADSQFIPVMNYMAASLGVRCNFCHVNKNGQWDYPSDEKEEKQVARKMITMVIDLNKASFNGNPEVSCYTCHRGRNQPTGVPPLPLPVPSPRPPAPAGPAAGQGTASPSPTPAQMTADQILAKYLNALGGQAAIDKLKTAVMKGTYAGSNGAVLPYEVEMVAPDKFHVLVTTQQGTMERAFDGTVGWEKAASGVAPLATNTLGTLKQMFLFYSNIKLKEQFTSMRVGRRDKIGDREVIAVSGRTADNRREQLYFDAETGLLVRRIRYTPTIIGIIPEQTDFEDYRDVDGVKFPFTVRVSSVEVGNPIGTRKYTEIKLNGPVDDSKFKMPAAPKPAGP
jgi:photosynthetic reaction center cytochrome c subunit